MRARFHRAWRAACAWPLTLSILPAVFFAQAALAADAGITSRSLVITDTGAVNGRSGITWSAEDDAGIQKGPGGDPQLVSGMLEVFYTDDPSNRAAFALPSPWERNSETSGRYGNGAAPEGGGVRRLTIENAESLKATTRSLGDADTLDVLGDPPGDGGITVVLRIANNADGSVHRMCTSFPGASIKVREVSGGDGRKLSAKGGVPAACPPEANENLCPNWPMYGRTPARTFSSDCPSPITRQNAATLVPAWVYDTQKTVTASPAVVDGVVYVGDWAGIMYAIDAAAGTLVWSYQTEQAPGAAFGPIVSSAAVVDVPPRRLVIFGAGPRLYALDAADGTPVWTHYAGATTPDGTPVLAADPIEIESSPVVWRGVVYVGVDPHNHPTSETAGVGGGLLALDAADGRPLWKFEPDPLGKGCGGMWSSPTLDTERGRIYMATANCPTDYGQPWGPYIEALTAVDATTGAPVWSFQPHAPNRSDWDFGATPNLFVDPAGRQVVGAGNKDGRYYAVDPDSGALLWSTQAAEPGDVQEDFAIGGFIGTPAIWQGRVYGGTALGGPPYMHALDARGGAMLWQDQTTGPSYAASATVNGLVFHGALDNVLRAFDTGTGQLLFSAPLAGPISSGPAIVGDTVYVGSGTSSSDLCAKPSDDPLSEAAFEACLSAFSEALGQTGAVHALRLAAGGSTEGGGGTLFNGQGNQLDQYDLGVEPPLASIWQPNAANGGKDQNAQICTFSALGRTYIVLGEDTDQSEGIPQGWGVFDVETKVEVGKLITSYGTTVQPEQYGCAIESDGAGNVSRIFVGQVGGGSFTDNDGQLIEFFPSSPALDAVYGRRTAQEVCPGGDCSALTQDDSDWCILDGDVATAGGMALDADGNVYLAESSPKVPPDNTPAPGRIVRYPAPFPTSADDCFTVEPATFIQAPEIATPGAIVAARDASGQPTGNWYVSSVLFPSVVNEYDAAGLLVRNIVPPGNGTPFGLAVDARGTLYFADIGVEPNPAAIPDDPDRLGFDTVDGAGSVQRVRFSMGVPLPPEVLKDQLDYPDGLGIVE